MGEFCLPPGLTDFKKPRLNRVKKEDQNGLSLHGLTVFFKMIEIIERQIAKERDKLDFHYRKWDLILPLL